MAKDLQENRLSSDKAKTEPSEDKLEYATFARYLANTIIDITPDEGMVLAVYAPWGAGKTTLLNFVEYYLEESKENRPVVVPFNPWWFSGQEDLALSFFQQLLRVLHKDNRLGKKTRKAVEKYADVIGQSVGTAASLAGVAHGIPTPNVGSLLSGALKGFGVSEKPINDLKADVENALKGSDTKLLIVIDDIDRLTAEEIRQMFRVVKAVANFPNVIYLLTFDRAIVAEALKKTQEGDGNDYLEKIIQVPFELPHPDRASLDQMFFGKFDSILNLGVKEQDNQILSTLFDVRYWSSTYTEGIRHFLDTPRDIVRLTNTLSVTYSSVRNEVNPVDFVAIECIRVFTPDVYDVIRRNPTMFVGAGNVPDYEKPEYKKFHENWLSAVDERHQKAVKYLISHLFPKTWTAWNDRGYSSDDSSSWGERRRIARPDVFPIFFRLTVPAGEISNLRMFQALENASSLDDFTKVLLDYQKKVRPDGTSMARIFLERFLDFTNKIVPEATIPVVLQAVFNAGDELIVNEPEDKRSFLDFGINWIIRSVVVQLLKRFSEEKRFVMLEAIFKETHSYYITVDVAWYLGVEHGKWEEKPNHEQLLTLEHVEILEGIALDKLRHNINLEHFSKNIAKIGFSLRWLLRIWSGWADNKEVQTWMEKMTVTDEGLANMLTCYFGINHRLNPFWLEPFLDPSLIRSRVENLAQDASLIPIQRFAVVEFLQEYADRDAGQNPDDVLYNPGKDVYNQMKIDRDMLVKAL